MRCPISFLIRSTWRLFAVFIAFIIFRENVILRKIIFSTLAHVLCKKSVFYTESFLTPRKFEGISNNRKWIISKIPPQISCTVLPFKHLNLLYIFLPNEGGLSLCDGLFSLLLIAYSCPFSFEISIAYCRMYVRVLKTFIGYFMDPYPNRQVAPCSHAFKILHIFLYIMTIFIISFKDILHFS